MQIKKQYMDKNITFSFVMPAYKARFIYKAIESILIQSYTDLELVIVDDDSPENLHDIVKTFHDERIRYIKNKKNIGGSDLVANWNQCIQYAKNEFIILATDDDMFESTFLSDAVVLISKYPDVNIIRSGVQKIDEEDNLLDIEFPLKEYMTSREFALAYAKGTMISCVSNYIFRKESLLKCGGFISFPKAHYSDDATALKMANNGIACIQLNHFKFRVSDINLSNRNDINIVREQIYATELFTKWYLNHINTLNTSPNDFFETACYGGAKIRYITMIEKLTNKIPISKVYIFLKTIHDLKLLFRKEQIRVLAMYFINKL